MFQDLVLPVLVSLLVGLYIVPFVQRVTRWRAPALERRDRFDRDLFQVITACTKLDATRSAEEGTEYLDGAIREERKRWIAQIDESTRNMIDNVEHVLRTYRGVRALYEPMIRCVSNVRLLWLSDKPESEKLAKIASVCVPLHAMLFGRWPWRFATQERPLLAALHAVDGQEAPSLLDDIAARRIEIQGRVIGRFTRSDRQRT